MKKTQKTMKIFPLNPPFLKAMARREGWVDFQVKNILSFLFCLLFLISCATAKSAKETVHSSQSAVHKEEPSTETKGAELKVSDYVPVNEDITPLQTKVVSISARNTPLRDVLYTIAEAVNLNLVMESGVKPDLPVTMTLNNMVVQDALNIIFDSVDYFYTIKDNILIVKSVGTKIFELGLPNVIHEYQTDIGGDILGGGSSATSGGGGTAGATGSGTIKGDLSMKSASDKVSFQFWDAMENSLKTLLPAPAGGEGIPKASFTINRMAGTIMVTASKKDLEKVENYITNLQKVLNRQVLIEARIIEVQLSEGLKYGIDWSFISNWRGVGKINITATKFSGVVGSTDPSFQIGVTGTGSDFPTILKALQEQGDVKTLSNPRINIMNGQTAMLSVGRNTTYLAKVESTTTSEGGATTTTYTTNEKTILSGVMFGLVPYISEDSKITMTITPIVSNLVSLDPKEIGSGTNKVEIKLPTVDLREMSTTVKVIDGQMVIIGGLINSKENLKEKKVPVLGSIPILGYLFKSVEKTYDKTELVIMLMPKIVSN
ncbi:MAG: pilus (MSHA type) biogenesis protein MshL [Thermodesulfovibrionia bacterium]|nr:pilus (MSHA type) biogenesis protein MshL [Thermodesulfovibrionia bacterium]